MMASIVICSCKKKWKRRDVVKRFTLNCWIETMLIFWERLFCQSHWKHEMILDSSVFLLWFCSIPLLKTQKTETSWHWWQPFLKLPHWYWSFSSGHLQSVTKKFIIHLISDMFSRNFLNFQQILRADLMNLKCYLPTVLPLSVVSSPRDLAPWKQQVTTGTC